MEGVEVPSYFLCPISLEIMRDPVTLMTGITYDRDNIERWMFSGENDACCCPVTKQAVGDGELTPNHTLRRLIQAWCAVNASATGIERFPTPRAPVNKAQIAKLLEEAKSSPDAQMASLKKLKMIISESERNKRCAEAVGAVEFLASLVKNSVAAVSSSRADEKSGGDDLKSSSAGDEALYILHTLKISEQGLIDLIVKNVDFIETLTSVLRQSNNYLSRAYAMLLLKSILGVVSPARLIRMRHEFFEQVVRALRDQISCQATSAALKVLAGMCPWGRNRVKSVEAGAVPVLVELLLGEPEKRECEMMLAVLEQLCGCAEGRVELTVHAAGIAVVSRTILRVSPGASERAVRILHSLSKNSASRAVLQEMLVVGAVSKLCLLIQMDCGLKTKEKVKEILGLHSRVWKHSPCLAPQLVAAYPSN